MVEANTYEASGTLGALLDRVQQGEEIVITREGRPVARLIPDASGVDRVQAYAALERIRVRAAALDATAFDWEQVKQDRDLGRR